MVSRFPRVGTKGVSIENISFRDINIDAVLALQALHGENCGTSAGLRDISFRDIRAKVTAGAYLCGNSDNQAENITFQDWDIEVRTERECPEMIDRVRFPEPIEGCVESDGKRILPAALYVKNVNDLLVRDIRVRWERNLDRRFIKPVWFEQCLLGNEA
jgi:hypothetical protein